MGPGSRSSVPVEETTCHCRALGAGRRQTPRTRSRGRARSAVAADAARVCGGLAAGCTPVPERLRWGLRLQNHLEAVVLPVDEDVVAFRRFVQRQAVGDHEARVDLAFLDALVQGPDVSPNVRPERLRSDEGGREELDEAWPSRASSSRMRACRATISAWAAAGVAAQISGGSGGAVSSIDRGIRRPRPGRNPRLSSGLNAHLPCQADANSGRDDDEEAGKLPASSV